MEADERRTHFRLPRNARVTCQEITYPLGAADEVEVGMLDVSQGGVRLLSPRAFEAGTLLQVALALEGWHRHTSGFRKHDYDSYAKPLTAVARVVRCGPSGEAAHELGLQFVDIWDDHWRAMREFLEQERRGERAQGG